MIAYTEKSLLHFNLSLDDANACRPYADFFVHGMKYLRAESSLSSDEMIVAALLTTIRKLTGNYPLERFSRIIESELYQKYPRFVHLCLSRENGDNFYVIRTDFAKSSFSDIDWRRFCDELDKRLPGRGETPENREIFLKIVHCVIGADQLCEFPMRITPSPITSTVSGFKTWIKEIITSPYTKIYNVPVDITQITARINNFIRVLGETRRVSFALAMKTIGQGCCTNQGI